MKNSNYCENCGKEIKEGKEVYLELSNTDFNYYFHIPENHVSQGSFLFGSTCAKKAINNEL